MGYFRDNIEAAEGYVPGEQPQDGSLIKLNTNENPYPPSPKALEAIGNAAGDILRKYPDPLANEARRAVAKLLSVKPQNILCANGSDDVISVAIRAIVEPGQPVTVPYPTYSLYETLVKMHGSQIEYVQCNKDFSLALDELAASTAPLVMVPNPNAPTGMAASVDDLATLAQSISGVLLIDEAYADFADDNAMRLACTEPNVLVMRTLSKSYSLAGLRFGYVVGSEELIAGLSKVRDSYPCDLLSIVGARVAIEDQAWMQQNRKKIIAERTRLVAGLDELGFTVLDSQANFVMARPPEGNARQLYTKLKDRGILVRYFNKPRIDEYLRITVGKTDEVSALLSELSDLLS